VIPLLSMLMCPDLLFIRRTNSRTFIDCPAQSARRVSGTSD
jgi:hypothetical protein